MFMSLQRFLPSVNDADAITWNTRDRGHPGNWTRESVGYCLGAALKIILQIQHAQFGAHAIPFQYVFEDVLTAKTDGVVLNSERARFWGGQRPFRKTVGELKRGQQIYGRVTPAYDADPPGKREEIDIEMANILVVSGAKGDALGPLAPLTDIIVRADLVELSYRVIDDPSVRERFPHLFEGM